MGYEKKERLEDNLKAQVSPCIHLSLEVIFKTFCFFISKLSVIHYFVHFKNDFLLLFCLCIFLSAAKRQIAILSWQFFLR